LLKLNNVKVHYGNVQALHGISIDVEEGSIVTLLGGNGAGKSTTLKAISGLVRPSSGTIEFRGKTFNGWEAHEAVKNGIIHCPEGRQIFPELTVHENLRIGSYRRKDRSGVKKDFERVLGYFPQLSDRLQQVAGTLSGGEQQMLAIGRALMGKPELLLLDEPSLGLAPILVREIFEIIQEINKEGTTILLVEQNVHMGLKVAQKGYILETGEIAISGTASELKSNDDIRRSYLGASVS
jgi:branched-chain amino acid transport system ATP-binding protein